MYKQGVGDFKYYVGISSLAQIATREDRVCVLNILGGESSEVTPAGHEYSGGNVVFGTSPGRRGQVLETKLGNVPVYNNVREGLDRRPPLQLRRDLSAAVGGARRRGRTDPRQPRAEEDLHGHREDVGARRARDPRDGAGQRHRHLRRQLPRRGGFVEPGAHRRRAGRRHAGGSAEEGLDRDLFQLRQLHHHDRHLPAHGGLGDDHAHLQRQGRLHPLRRARVRLCAGQRRAHQGRGALRRAGRLLRARRRLHQAGRRLRRRALEGQAHARRRPRRRDGGRQRRRRRQGTLVHGQVRRGRHLHVRTSRCSPPRARW